MINKTLLTVVIGTNYFILKRLTPRAKQAAIEFSKKYIKYGLVKVQRNKFSRAAIAVFGAATKDREEFRFHINQFKEFLDFFNRNFIDEKLIEFIRKDVPVASKIDVKAREEWILRDEQLPVLEYMLDNSTRVKLVGLQTGKGKSLIAMKAVAEIGKKTAIIVRPMFIYKWIADVQKYLDIPTERIMVVQGSKDLMAVLQLAENNGLDDIDIFIFSNKTIQMWLKLYEDKRKYTLDLGYACLPEDMFELLKIGVRLIDEVHMDFHLNFKLDLYTNVEKSISLSATLINKDPFMERVYEIAYPADERFKVPALDRYIDAKAVIYYLDDNRKVRANEYGSTNYSHSAFEESVMKDREFLDNYLKLIKYVSDIGYIKDYVKGQRMIIFCYKKEFCTIVTNYLQRCYRHLDVRRYVAEDPDENMYEPDIRVTTLGSGSTAHDIAMLKTAIMTVSVDSIQSNIQALGRLRRLDGVIPKFFYLACAQIPKQMQYHDSKRQLLRERAKTFNIIEPPFNI